MSERRRRMLSPEAKEFLRYLQADQRRIWRALFLVTVMTACSAFVAVSLMLVLWPR